MMLPFSKTIDSIKKASLLGIMLICAGLAIVIVVLASGLLTWGVSQLVNLQTAWLDTMINWIVGGLSGIGGWFMLPVLIVLISSVFQELTIHRVEKAYYPDSMRTEEPRFWSDIAHDIRFTLLALFLNILILPLYLLGIGFIFSIVLNSYLLGREFFEGAAGYHLGKPAAKKLIQRHRAAVYSGGFIITMMTLIPVINLFMPIFAIVWMVHVYHGIKTQ
ncbi:MAG: EI24 domain-containing protein [Desulfobulbaceae bacterium]|nr:EI24 domain-containing protein [Desulfobulbaceae bacterium]